MGGVVITPNGGNGAFLLLAGFHHLLGRKVTAGINYFYSNRKVFSTIENRLLADADLNLSKGKTFNAGIYYGKSTSDINAFSGNSFGGFIKGYVPVSNAIAILAGVSAENNFIQNLFSMNVGFRFRLEK